MKQTVPEMQMLQMGESSIPKIEIRQISFVFNLIYFNQFDTKHKFNDAVQKEIYAEKYATVDLHNYYGLKKFFFFFKFQF